MTLGNENSSFSRKNVNKLKTHSSSKNNARRNNVLIINNKKTQAKSNIFNENRVTSGDVKVIFTKKDINNKKECLFTSSSLKSRKFTQKIANENLFNVSSIKKEKTVKFTNDEIGKTSLSNKNKYNKKLEESRDKEFLLTPLSQSKIKNRVLNRKNTNFRNISLKMTIEDFTNKYKNAQNDADLKNNEIKHMTKLKINNLYEVSFDKAKYEKKFNIYRNKDPSNLFSLINISKEPFHKKEILSLYRWTYNKKLISKNNVINNLDKKLYDGLLKCDLA